MGLLGAIALRTLVRVSVASIALWVYLVIELASMDAIRL